MREPTVTIIGSETGMATKLIFWRESADPNVMEALVQEGNQRRWKEFGFSEEAPALLTVTRMEERNGFWQQLANALHSSFGIVAERAPVHIDELEATRRHLEDFRTIVFGFDKVDLHREEPMVRKSEQEEEDAEV